MILRSTVPIGTTRNAVVPILEKISGLKAGDDFFVAFAPERTVEGKALEELRRIPQVIGGVNHASTEFAGRLFGYLTPTTVLVDSLEEAEIVKLINNSYRDTTFAFANEVALICQKFGIDTHRVIEAANRDYARSLVPLPSPGVGGYCLEKDPFILIESARSKNHEPVLLKHARAVSEAMIDFVVEEVRRFLAEQKKNVADPKIAIFGFAFKGNPVTSDMRGSTTVKVVERLRKHHRNIHGFDPAIKSADIRALHVRPARDPAHAFTGADAVLVMNNNPFFRELDARRLLNLSRKPVLFFDAWGLHHGPDILKVRGSHYKKL